MEILLKDGVKYFPYVYKNENELENMVFEHHKEIFGEDAILLSKYVITTPSGIGAVPDAFVLSIKQKKWFIVEVELSKHSLYQHIVPQVTKFYNAIKNPSTKTRLARIFHREIDQDPRKNVLFELENIRSEKYKFISEIIEEEPTTVIIIDEKVEELDEICSILPFNSYIIVFKTFHRINKDLCDHIHFISPLIGIPSGVIQPIKLKHTNESLSNFIEISGDSQSTKHVGKEKYPGRHDEILRFFNKGVLPMEYTVRKKYDYLQICLYKGYYPLHYEWRYFKDKISAAIHFEFPDYNKNQALANEFYKKFYKEIEKSTGISPVLAGEKKKSVRMVRKIENWTEEDAKWAAKTMEKLISITKKWVLEKMRN